MAAHLLCCCNITRRELLMNDKYICLLYTSDAADE